MSLRQAAQQALEALEGNPISHAGLVNTKHAIAALRAALAEPEQGPDGISWLKRDSGYFTAPTPRKPLTNEEISAIFDDTLEGGSFFDVALAVARAIERAHGIGGGE